MEKGTTMVREQMRAKSDLHCEGQFLCCLRGSLSCLLEEEVGRDGEEQLVQRS